MDLGIFYIAPGLFAALIHLPINEKRAEAFEPARV